MFGLFKKKPEAEILREKYGKLLEESYILSKSNRTESDKKFAEAEAIMKQLDALQPK